MKTRSFAVDLLLLASILLSTSCAASTPAASPTLPATQTPTPAATQTTVSTETQLPPELQLPEGPIIKLQKILGDDYTIKLTEDKKYAQIFEMGSDLPLSDVRIDLSDPKTPHGQGYINILILQGKCTKTFKVIQSS